MPEATAHPVAIALTQRNARRILQARTGLAAPADLTEVALRLRTLRSKRLTEVNKVDIAEPTYGVVVNQTFTVPIEKTEPSAGRIL